jgi:O-antigen/teichoic acid export membrane protein
VSDSKQSANRRLSLITTDQIISGASNVLIAVLAAHYLSVALFGYFGIVLLVYALTIGVHRALILDPMLVHSREAGERPGDVIGASAILGVALALVLLAGGLALLALNTVLGDALLALALCTPLLIVQDLGRYLAFAFQRPSAAIVLDVAWLVLMLAAVAAITQLDTHSLPALILAWGGSGALAGLLVFVQHLGVRPRLSFSWLRYTWRFSWRYLISYSSQQGSALVVLSGVGAIAGAAARGGLQGTLLFIRPYTTFQIGASASAVGEISRDHLRGDRVRHQAAKTTLITAGVALVNGIVILALPDRLGELLLGNAWDAAKPLLLPTCAQILVLGLLTGARVGLLGMREIHRVVVIDLISTPVFLVTTLSGAVVAGAPGALWFGAAGQAVMATIWWFTFLRHADDVAPSSSVDPLMHGPEPAAATAMESG